MKTFLSYLLFFALVPSAFPCANTFFSYQTKYNGMPVKPGSRMASVALRSILRYQMAVDGEGMEKALRGATEFEKRNDYSVALMYLGRNAEAVELLQTLEKENPGNYSVAANLGTAFELSGANRDALRWIKEGIRRNAQSHEGTEWLHVKILEAKIAAQQDAHYFDSHSVLGLKAGDIGSIVKIDGHKLRPEELMAAIQHQLMERLKFVKPPDPAVASLLFDYSAIEAAVSSLEGAKDILSLSREFGYPEAPVQALMQHYNDRISRFNVIAAVLVVSGIIGFLVFCYKRGWFVLTSSWHSPRF
ncbi:MAG: tetratricopeptide repeat family protein [Verrucomicrobiales bacterium]|nr:tetratricopeptide repeat family protein [Verrucomicrobiales bacterium]